MLLEYFQEEMPSSLLLLQCSLYSLCLCLTWKKPQNFRDLIFCRIPALTVLSGLEYRLHLNTHKKLFLAPDTPKRVLYSWTLLLSNTLFTDSTRNEETCFEKNSLDLRQNLINILTKAFLQSPL